jgi:hypothetical protein
MAEAVAAPPRAGRCGRNISSGATEVAGPCHWTCRQIVAVAPLDTTLIPPRTQYGATRSNVEKGNPFRYGGFAILCIPLQRLRDQS